MAVPDNLRQVQDGRFWLAARSRAGRIPPCRSSLSLHQRHSTTLPRQWATTGCRHWVQEIRRRHDVTLLAAMLAADKCRFGNVVGSSFCRLPDVVRMSSAKSGRRMDTASDVVRRCYVVVFSADRAIDNCGFVRPSLCLSHSWARPIRFEISKRILHTPHDRAMFLLFWGKISWSWI